MASNKTNHKAKRGGGKRGSRRDFLKGAAAAAVAAGTVGSLSIARGAHAKGEELIKIALIGCGGRGTGACSQALNTKGPVKLVAMGDAFADRLQQSLKNLQQEPELKQRIDVPKDRQFVGLDAYQKVLQTDVDLVLLATAPGFRPEQYTAAVKAGKQIFMEKPCAVDAPGYRKLLAANAQAKQKGLSVVVGLQRHHQSNYIEKIKQIHDGAVGQIKLIRTYFNMPGGTTGPTRKPDETEMAYQIRHWGVFTWLSGDHLVEQTVHSIDVVNWVMGFKPPISANGMGGRQVRTGKGTGQIYDHHCVEYEYPDGVRYFCQARQIGGTWQYVSEVVHGAKDTMTLGIGPYGGFDVSDSRGGGKRVANPYQQEHDDLFAAVRSGKPLFEGDYAASSTMLAILGRMATYSGKLVTWEDAVKSELSLGPAELTFDAPPPVLPDADGKYPVAMPGTSRAW